MIYKFKFEVVDDDNNHVFCARSEESGNFWWAFMCYLKYVMDYAQIIKIPEPPSKFPPNREHLG